MRWDLQSLRAIMGNYKSRPQNSCSEEHLKKISELHHHISQKISSDLQLLEPCSLSELQESCCRAEVRVLVRKLVCFINTLATSVAIMTI